MGHKRIDETMLYVHFAEAHLRPIPDAVREAQRDQDDPDRKVVAMLNARSSCVPRGSGPQEAPRTEESSLISAT